MFWRLGFNSNTSTTTTSTVTSTTATLLEKKEVKLEEILADPDVLYEVRSHNTKLISFLSKRESLLDLVSLFFSFENDKQRLPLVACKILASDIPEIIDAIMIDHRDVLQALWNFLNVPYSPGRNYAVQSSWFLKIITVFVTKRAGEMLCFVKSSPYHLEKILNRLQDSSIMELFLSLIRLEELPEVKGFVQWLYENKCLINLIHRLDPHLDSDEHKIAEQCLSEVVKISQTSLADSPSIRANPLILQLTSKETIETIMGYMLENQAPNSTSTITSCVTLLIDIIRHNNSDLDQEASSFDPDFFVSLADLLQVTSAHVEALNQILMDQTRRAVGLDRIKIFELYAELLHCSNMSSLNQTESAGDSPHQAESIGDGLKLAFYQHHVLSTSIDLFFAFPWNNVLHYAVYDILHQVMNGPIDNAYNLQLIISLFTQSQLTDKIVDAQEENDRICKKPRGTRLGYMGYLTCISDEIIKLFEGYPDSVLGAIKDSVNLDRWYAYCDNQLQETKARDNIPFGQDAKTPTDEKLEDDVAIYDPSWSNMQTITSIEPISVKKDLDPFSVAEDETIYSKEDIQSSFTDLDLSTVQLDDTKAEVTVNL